MPILNMEGSDMMVMTAKVDKKKIAIIFAAVIVAIAALVLLISGGGNSAPTSATTPARIPHRTAWEKALRF